MLLWLEPHHALQHLDEEEVRSHTQISNFVNNVWGLDRRFLLKANDLTIQIWDFPKKLLHLQMVQLHFVMNASHFLG